MPGRRREHDASLAKMKSAFERAHKAQFGFIDRTKALVIEAVSVEAVGGGATFREKRRKVTRTKLPAPARRTRFFSGGKWHRALVYTRDTLAPGHKIKGPAIVIEPHQTVVVEHGWQAELTAKNHLVLRRVQKLARMRAIGTKADPVMLEVFNNLFMSIAEQMGVALQNTAYSVNIKERLDFSCAVFDAAARSSPTRRICRCISARWIALSKPSSAKTRARSGRATPISSTRPITAVPTFPISPYARRFLTAQRKKILFWVASRGHHADIGGIAPGSMSPIATTHRRGGHLHRQLQAGRSRQIPRSRALRPAHQREISGAQSVAECQRPKSADRGLRKGRAGNAQDGRSVRP